MTLITCAVCDDYLFETDSPATESGDASLPEFVCDSCCDRGAGVDSFGHPLTRYIPADHGFTAIAGDSTGFSGPMGL
jgi:hypothetical protein